MREDNNAEVLKGKYSGTGPPFIAISATLLLSGDASPASLLCMMLISPHLSNHLLLVDTT